jgi:dihydrofolate reductase
MTAKTTPRVTAQMSLSLDGCYAGPRFTGAPTDVAGWMATEAPGFFRVTRWAIAAMSWRQRQGFAGGEESVSSQIIEETMSSAGAHVMGRRMFDGGEIPWGDEPPFRAPVFVVTNRPRPPLERKGGTTFTFVTDGIARAVELAREAAGDRNVAIAGGGTLLRQALEAGLVDELDIHIAPVVLGSGMRLFDGLDVGPGNGLELTPIRVVETPDVTHIRYRVDGPAELVLDDRGSGESLWSDEDQAGDRQTAGSAS